MAIERIEIRNEKIYLKRSFDGWRVVYPLRDDEGNLNLRNIIFGGNGWHLIKLCFVLLLIFFMIWSYVHDVKEYKNAVEVCFSNPCGVCQSISQFETDYGVNLSAFKLMNWTK